MLLTEPLLCPQVYDAKTMAQNPVASVKLPQRVPFGEPFTFVRVTHQHALSHNYSCWIALLWPRTHACRVVCIQGHPNSHDQKVAFIPSAPSILLLSYTSPAPSVAFLLSTPSSILPHSPVHPPTLPCITGARLAMQASTPPG